MGFFSVFTFRSKFITKVLIIIISLWVFYTEFLTYWMLPMTWTELPHCYKPDCKKLLLVSDPQLIGPEWDKFFLMDYLAIWDSDRYIRRTFLLAKNYIKPDIIIFLGDLMDQGHIASENEFQLYIKRLRNIFEFPVSSKDPNFIFLPGDNDIGGIDDILMPENIKRFNDIFNQTQECIIILNIQFCKINIMTASLQQSQVNDKEIIKVVLSHVPLIPKEHYFLRKVIKKIKPQLIFSGHAHVSSHFTAYETDIWSYKHNKIYPTETKPKIYYFHEGLIHEVTVPTCSYRMGVSSVGYGAAFLDTKKQAVYYNVLWLPQRFSQLFLYLVIATPFVFFALMWMIVKIRR